MSREPLGAAAPDHANDNEPTRAVWTRMDLR